MTPMLIGLLLASVQLFFIAFLGKYIPRIHTLVQKQRLAMGRERIEIGAAA